MLQRTGIEAVIHDRRVAGRRPLILAYHRVVEDFEASSTTAMPSLLVSSETLERQLDWLGHRFDFVTLEEALRWMRGELTLARPAAVVTFDDGYVDVHQHAWPILRAKGIPFVVFIVTDLAGTDELQFHDALYLAIAGGFSGCRDAVRRFTVLFEQAGVPRAVAARALRRIDDPMTVVRVLLTSLPHTTLARIVRLLNDATGLPETVPVGMRSMNWDMLMELASDGIEIGSHTRSHVFLTNQASERVTDEVSASKQHAERMLGIPIRYFAYPDGDFNASVVAAVARAGYRFGFTICSHRDRQHPWLTIPRRPLWEYSGYDMLQRFSDRVFACETSGVFDPLARLRCTHG